MRVVFFQAEDGIRDLVRSRGLGDVYKRQSLLLLVAAWAASPATGPLAAVRADLAALARVPRLSLIHI